MVEKIPQRYEGCFTFGDVRKVWFFVGALVGLAVSNAQPVCIKPNRIPAIREAMQAPGESAVDRTGPWELSRPVAVKYGLKLSGPVDERLDSSCAQFASEQQWKQLFHLYKDSALADIAVAVSPSFAARTAKRWASDPCAKNADVLRIKEFEIRTTPTAKPGWSREAILQAHLSFAAASIRTEGAPVLTEQSLGTVPLSAGTSPAVATASHPATQTPSAPPAPSSVPKKVRYVVKNGDSLWKIARKFPTTSEAELVRINKGKTTIYPGQILWIPL
jgi:LysM repeat protein